MKREHTTKAFALSCLTATMLLCACTPPMWGSIKLADVQAEAIKLCGKLPTVEKITVMVDKAVRNGEDLSGLQQPDQIARAFCRAKGATVSK